MSLSSLPANSDGGLKTTPSEGIIRRQVKDSVVIGYGMCVALDDNNQAKLPAGDNDTRAVGFSLEDATVTGDDDHPVFIDIGIGIAGAPFIGAGVIENGQTIASKGTAGKVDVSTTSGAILGTCTRRCSADGKRGFVNQLSK